MPESPYKSPADSADRTQKKTEPLTTGREAYNVVSDTVTGINFRGSDNKFQAKFILISVVVCALVGVLLAVLNSGWNLPWFGGALIGSFAGLIFGVFGSGIYLMIYRAARHMQGKHD